MKKALNLLRGDRIIVDGAVREVAFIHANLSGGLVRITFADGAYESVEVHFNRAYKLA